MYAYLYYIFLGFTPAIFCVWYFYRKDKWEPEPAHKVMKIFIIGILSILPAGFLEWFFQHYIFQITVVDMKQFLTLNLVACFLVIGPIEEFFKYSVVRVFIYNNEDFNEKVDGVVYMIAAAMGFSALENFMYILNVGQIHGHTGAATIGILRGLLATPAHAIFSGFVGIYVGKSRFASTKMESIRLIFYGLLIGIFLHGLYNSLIFAGGIYSFFVIPLLIVSGLILMKMVKKLVDESPFKPEPKTE